MSCRNTPAGSAMTTYARLYNHRILSDPAVLSLFHELKKQYKSLPSESGLRAPITREQYDTLIDGTIYSINRPYNQNMTQKNKDSILARLEIARNQPLPDPALYYALLKINEAVRTRGIGIERFTNRISRSLQLPPGEVRKDFIETAAKKESRDTSRITNAARETAKQYGLGVDDGMLGAIQLFLDQLDATSKGILNQSSIPRIVRSPVAGYGQNTGIDNLTLEEIGVDRRVGRIEVVILDAGTNEKQIYAYRVPAELLNRFEPSSSGSTDHFGALWATELRGNNIYAYLSQSEADAAGRAPSCSTCGQFANTQHSCPTLVEPRVLDFANTAGVWSRQKLPNGAKVELPPVTEFRTAFATGAVTVNDISHGQHYGAKITGSITAFLDESQNLKIDTNKLDCECPAFRNNATCQHLTNVIEAVRIRLEPMATRIQGYTPTKRTRYMDVARAKYIQEDIDKANIIYARDWTRREATLEEARKNWLKEQSVLYSENFEAFEAVYREARRSKAANNGKPVIPYMKENALNGFATRESGQGFGVELEFTFDPTLSSEARAENIRKIGEDLFHAGLTPSASKVGYHHAQNAGYEDTQKDAITGLGNWSYESDSTVDGELVSPTMYDEPETWENLEKAINILRKNGATVSKSVGGHVHVGTAFFAGDPSKYTELARLMTQHEDVMFRLAADPARGTHRMSHHAAPISEVPSTGFTNITAARQATGRRALNFSQILGGDGDHPEFRIFDGTLDPGAVQAQIKLAVAMTHAADRQSQNGGTKRTKEPVGSHLEILKKKTQQSDTYDLKAETATTRSLLDTLFSREEDKKQLVTIFANTQWSPGQPVQKRTRHRTYG